MQSPEHTGFNFYRDPDLRETRVQDLGVGATDDTGTPYELVFLVYTVLLSKLETIASTVSEE